MENTRLVLCGGGSGGHVIPNISIAMHAKQHRPDIRTYYIWEKQSLEQDLCNKYDISFYGIKAGKLRRYFSFTTLLDVGKTFFGILQSFWILLAVKPHLIFSKGGFVSLPVILAGYFLRIPVYVHESDTVPGISSKIGARFARKVLLGFPEAQKYFPKARAHISYNIPHFSFFSDTKPKQDAKQNKPTLLVLGGSQGAKAINDWVLENLATLTSYYHVIHQCGQAKYPEVFHQSQNINHESQNYRLLAFIQEDYAHTLTNADIIISRSGATSLSDIAYVQKPAILVPYPYAANQHQEQNAQSFEKNFSNITTQMQTGDKLELSIESIQKTLRASWINPTHLVYARPETILNIILSK